MIAVLAAKFCPTSIIQHQQLLKQNLGANLIGSECTERAANVGEQFNLDVLVRMFAGEDLCRLARLITAAKRVCNREQYPTRESEFDHRRLQVPPSPLHDLSPRPSSQHGSKRAINRALNA